VTDKSRNTGRVLGKQSGPVNVTVISGRGQLSSGVLRDRSLGGIGIEASERLNLEPGKSIDLELDSPKGPVKLVGIIAWCDENRAGIRFEHLSMVELQSWFEFYFDGVDLNEPKDDE
jgi:PilZ domain